MSIEAQNTINEKTVSNLKQSYVIFSINATSKSTLSQHLWILNFHKVVQQHIPGEVGVFVTANRMFHWESSGERIL